MIILYVILFQGCRNLVTGKVVSDILLSCRQVPTYLPAAYLENVDGRNKINFELIDEGIVPAPLHD